jgi:hypothetical protein
MHEAAYSRQASGLDQKRFYNAGRIINAAISHKYNRDYNDALLQFRCDTRLDSVKIFANYNSLAVQRLYPDPFEDNNLNAPIGQVPFDSIYNAIKELLNNCFTNWQTTGMSGTRLIKTFNTYDERGVILLNLCELESILSDIKRFELGISQIKDNNTFQIIVSKDKLDQAIALIGYTSVVAQYTQTPSIARLVSSSSPIMSNTSQSSSSSSSNSNLFDASVRYNPFS